MRRKRIHEPASLKVDAGVRQIVTVNGSGFGAFSGSAAVCFDDADDGVSGSFGAASATHIVSWTDSAIQVLVPGGSVGAGTGKVIVRDSAGGDAFSPGDLTVRYALNDVLTGAPSIHRVSLENENGRGGYTYRDSTSTANNGSNFTGVAAAYGISVATGPANDEDVRAYVDWNNDGTLASGELAFSSDDTTIHNGLANVPAGAVKNTALRIRVFSDFFPQGIAGACENIELGQTAVDCSTGGATFFDGLSLSGQPIAVAAGVAVEPGSARMVPR